VERGSVVVPRPAPTMRAGKSTAALDALRLRLTLGCMMMQTSHIASHALLDEMPDGWC
jgi:hypothetical protein